MALPSSGPLSINDIAGEFGGSTPHAMSEYYAGGGLVPAGTSGTYGAVPSSGTISIQNFYGTSNFVPVYIEDVFSTWLYTGNGGAQTITNGIDLAGKGGLTWIKDRANSNDHALFNLPGGSGPVYTIGYQASNSTSGTITTSPTTVLNSSSSGFGLNGSSTVLNGSGRPYVSWTFREQPKFFDVVTYTGNASNRTIAHNLGSVPGCIIIKCTSVDGTSWMVYHRGIGASQYIRLNLPDMAFTGSDVWNGTSPSSTVFSLGTSSAVNGNGLSYVAYLFAHDAGGFGLTGADNVISCGSFSATSGSTTSVTLGYEPAWILVKRSTGSESWFMADNMRGWFAPPSTTTRTLVPNSSINEFDVGATWAPTATGFDFSFNTGTYIYIAIRRGPMKTPTTGTSVFYPQTISQADTIDSTGVPFPPDLVNTFSRNGSDRVSAFDQFLFVDRLRGLGIPSNTFTAANSGVGLVSSSPNAEMTAVNTYVQLKADSQNITRGPFWNSPSYGNWIYYFMRRAPRFFDVVCYTGDTASSQKAHNLGVPPELTIIKARSTTSDWPVGYGSYSGSILTLSYYSNFVLNSNAGRGSLNAVYSYSGPPYSQFFGVPSLGNANGVTYVAYLFASCPGVSKIGTYNGTAALQTIDCGFTSGARFVLIKRTNSAGEWFVYDSARGITSGNDPYLLMNSSDAEVTGTNYVDTTSVGFQVTAAGAADVNAIGGTYIFLAIA